MWATVESVAGGTEVVEECACGKDRVQCPMVALTPDGITTLGRLSECDDCGHHFRCAYCGRFVAFDAAEIWTHVMGKHGRRGDD